MASRSWNKVELIGNLTRDPELKYTPNGAAVATFSIATNRSYMIDGEKKEEVDFHRIVAWNKLAELCAQLMKKGNRVFVSGRLQNRSWQDQNGGQRQMTEIVLEDMILLTNRGTESGGEYVQHDAPEEVPSRSAEVMPEEKVVDTAKGEASDKAEDEPSKPKVEAPKAPKEDIGDIDDLPF